MADQEWECTNKIKVNGETPKQVHDKDGNAIAKVKVNADLVYAKDHEGETTSYDSSSHWHVCDNCGATFGKAAHTLSTTRTSSPTCTATGNDCTSCSGCSYTKDTTVAALGHNWANGSGYAYYNSSQHYDWCTRCGTTLYQNHSYSSSLNSNSSGHYYSYYCSGCGYSYSGSTSSHSYGSWSASSSSHSRSCSTCGYSQSGSHSWGYDGSNTGGYYHEKYCTTCNYTTEESCTPSGSYVSNDSNGHYRYCSKCGQPGESGSAHTYRSSYYSGKKCTVCGYTKS